MKSKKNIILKVRIIIISGSNEELVHGKCIHRSYLDCWPYSRCSSPVTLFPNHGIEVLPFSLIGLT